MHAIRSWMSEQLARISQLSLLSSLFQIAERQVVLGGLGGGAVLMLLGAMLGARNRGFAGAVIGALSALIAGILLGGLVGSLFISRQGEVDADFDLQAKDGGYAPGDALVGYVRLIPKRSGRISGGRVALVCRGFYVHDDGMDDASEEPRLMRDVRTLHVQELPIIPSGIVRRGSPVRYPFRITLPEHTLPTHHGFACSVRWSLHIILDDAADASDQGSQEILMQAVAPVGVGARSERVSITSPVCELVLALPRTTYAEGDAVQGRVIVNPEDDFVASEVRALLLRVEHNPKGDDHIIYITGWNPDTGRFRGESRPGGQGTTYVWLEDEVDLAEQVHLTQREKRLFDFSFQLSQQWRPTLQTEQGDVSWRVVAVLSRSNGRDMRVHQAITVHTGAPHVARVLAPDMTLDAGAGAD